MIIEIAHDIDDDDDVECALHRFFILEKEKVENKSNYDIAMMITMLLIMLMKSDQRIFYF